MWAEMSVEREAEAAFIFPQSISKMLQILALRRRFCCNV
jgi:hypothetical protein